MWKLVYGTVLFLLAMFTLFLSSPFSFDNIVSGFGSSLSYTALHTNHSRQPRLLLDRTSCHFDGFVEFNIVNFEDVEDHKP